MTHRQTQNGVARGGLGLEGNEADRGDKPRTYRMVFSTKVIPRPCPVGGCSVQALMRTTIRVHFCHRHVRDTVVILEEGNLPHPQCPLRDMLVLWRALNGTHRCTAHCKQGADRKRRRLASEEEREVTARIFSAYGFPLGMLTSFGYLVQVILEA